MLWLCPFGLKVAEAVPQDVGALGPVRRLIPPRPPLREAEPAPVGTGEESPLPLRGFRVRITDPAPGEVVGGRMEVRVDVEADRPEAVLFVEFEVDGRVVFVDAEAPYELIWRVREIRRHRISARAYGPAGGIAEDVLYTREPPAALAAAAFRSRVERVEIFARLEDDEAPVRAKVEDFVVRENGREQPVLEVERARDLPVAVGLMVDCSGSMIDRLSMALDAAGSFIEGLVTRPQDKAFVMTFADVTSLLQGFTNDLERLEWSLDLIRRGRNTKLYDAVEAAAERFAGHAGRRALVVLTDGHDARSEIGLEEAIRAAQRADVAIYPVAVGVTSRFFFERWVLEKMARETGGRVWDLRPMDDPRRIYEAIAEDLRNQVRITYEPTIPGGDGGWRTIEVRFAGDEGGEGDRLRARPGYYAE